MLSETLNYFIQHYSVFCSGSFVFVFLVTLGLGIPTREQTRALAVKPLSPNHWTAREFPVLGEFLLVYLSYFNHHFPRLSFPANVPV